jgi:hypothetical protein
MDKEKEGVLDTIAQAAKTSMEATVEGVTSAATNIVDAVTGRTEKPLRRRKRSSTTKAAGRGRTATRRGKAKRSAGGRRSAAARGRKATRKASTSRGKPKRSSTRRTSSSAATRKVYPEDRWEQAY